MFSTGFSIRPEMLAETMDGETVTWMKKMASSKKVIITGSLIIVEDGNYYNRLIWMLPNQQYGYYDKRHLFAFAGEHEHYAAGAKRLIASVKGWKINLQVCYDLRFPVWARQKNSPVLSLEDEDDKEFGGRLSYILRTAEFFIILIFQRKDRRIFLSCPHGKTQIVTYLQIDLPSFY